SGFLALFDDIAALTKVAASQVDDVMAQAAKVGSKTVGVVVDDAAVTPKYVQGLPAARELPIVWRIARGSLFNKLIILLPLAMVLQAIAPWALPPLLMLGGAYLCFEGAEKVLHVIKPHDDDGYHAPKPKAIDDAHLEEDRVKKAIKTDFILSAEIMVIALSVIEADTLWAKGAILAAVAVGITAIVYGSVAILVRADDVGLKLSQNERVKAARVVGRAIVKTMPKVMVALSVIGTTAMLWVGGSIIIHSLEQLGFGWLGHHIHDLAHLVGHSVPSVEGFLTWSVTAGLDGVFGLLLGASLIPVVTAVKKLTARLKPKA
ncbi:MAG: DUF808 domain-containing protein, partial [Pseudomonadota bacterium]